MKKDDTLIKVDNIFTDKKYAHDLGYDFGIEVADNYFYNTEPNFHEPNGKNFGAFKEGLYAGIYQRFSYHEYEKQQEWFTDAMQKKCYNEAFNDFFQMYLMIQLFNGMIK